MASWVYKHRLSPGGHDQRLGESPGRVVHVGVQGATPFAWVEHREGPANRAPLVRVVVTGAHVEAGERHVGAFLLDGGAFVGHVYELVQGVQ